MSVQCSVWCKQLLIVGLEDTRICASRILSSKRLSTAFAYASSEIDTISGKKHELGQLWESKKITTLASTLFIFFSCDPFQIFFLNFSILMIPYLPSLFNLKNVQVIGHRNSMCHVVSECSTWQNFVNMECFGNCKIILCLGHGYYFYSSQVSTKRLITILKRGISA